MEQSFFLLMPFAPLTNVLHFARLFAVLSSSPQLSPFPAISAWTLLLQLFLGRPGFLPPCGFHFRACGVMFVSGFLRVCPIQLHFLLRISMSIGSWLVLFHRSTLLILSFPQMFIILLRQDRKSTRLNS